MAQYISQSCLEGPIWLEPGDISFLHNLVAETKTRVECLENQIKQADEDHITALIHEKDAKMVEIASLRNILSPIRRIPLEILSEILELSCFPVDGIFTADYKILQYISRVSLVCVAWRKAALSTPKLWSKICIIDKVCHVEQMDQWFLRSKDIPLELYLHISDFCDIRMDCILKFRAQVAVIDLSRGISLACLPLLHLPRASFPLLEKLSLGEADMDLLDYSLPHRIEAFFGAPRLQHLSIRETSQVPMFAKLMLPLERLTSLEIHLGLYKHVELQVYHDTLHQCGNLVSLKVYSSTRRLGFDSDFSICLPSLKFLDITCWNVSPHHFTLLHGLMTPILEGLVLRWNDQDIHDLCRDVAGLQSCSVTTLTLLCGYRTVHNMDDILLILDAFPTVQSFTINPGKRKNDIDVLIQAMIYTKSKPVLLPRLTNLDISSLEHLNGDSVISLIRSRWWPDSMDSEMSNDCGVARLRRVTLFGHISDSIVKRDDFDFPTLVVDLKYCAISA